jgi:hypothetical protein
MPSLLRECYEIIETNGTIEARNSPNHSNNSTSTLRKTIDENVAKPRRSGDPVILA